MAKGGSSGENYQPQATWLERKPARIRKAPTTTWRKKHTPARKKVLQSMSSDNMDQTLPPETIKGGADPLMIVTSSTGYSTDTFEREEDQFLKDLERPKTSSRLVMNAAKSSAAFAFQKRLARIDWRTVHTIDVDRVIRQTDINTLEMVLDTIAFGDIQGEDTRNFTEANFVKIFRLAQLMVEYLLHVQELLADHKAELLQAGATMQQKNEKIRSRFLWQRNTLVQTRHELKQAKKTLKTYEVMLKMQGKAQFSQMNQSQVRHCPFCEKAFESSYYLDMHVARRHQRLKQEVNEDKILAVVTKAEEATAARVKAETSLAVQTELQQLRERYQEDLQRTEATSSTQVRSLQADLKLSNNQLYELQTRLEILQAQIISASPSIPRVGDLYAVEHPKERDNGPDQERLYDLEKKFAGLEHQVKTLGQENSRLLNELNSAHTEVSDLQSAKRQKVFALENQVDDLRKEIQHLKRSKVNIVADTAGDEHDEPTCDQYVDYPTGDPPLIYSSLLLKVPHFEPVEVPVESIEVQEDETNVHICHDIPEHILTPPESEVSDVLDFPNTTVQPPSIIDTCIILEESSAPVHDSQRTGEFQQLQFHENITAMTMVEEEPLLKEKRGPSPRERWIRQPEKDEALLALARPTAGRRRTEEPSDEQEESSPEEAELYRPSTSPVKYETSPERIMRKSAMQRPKTAAIRKGKPRGDESPSTVEEMRAKLEAEMAAAQKEQVRRQKAVERLLSKELEKEKLEEKKLRGKRTDARGSKPTTQYSSKSESPVESIAPLLLALRKRREEATKASSIHTVRKIVENNKKQVIHPKPCFHSSQPVPHKPGPGCRRSLPAAAVHPYVRPGLGISMGSIPQIRPQTAAAVHTSNPNQIPKHVRPLLKGDLALRFPPGKSPLRNSKPSAVINLEPTKPESDSPDSEANVSDVDSPFASLVFEEDEVEKRTTSNEDEKVHRIEEIAEVASMDVGEEAPSIPIPEKQKWLTEHPFVPIPTLPHVVAKYPHPETAFKKAHKEIANEFDGVLREELKKFGVASVDTNGISDTTYNSISTALEKQRSMRMSQIHGSDRKVVEYERGAIVWHTQRAIHDRDIEIIESQFDVASNSGSDHQKDGNASGDSGDESGKSDYNSSRSHQSDNSDREDFREDETKPLGGSHMKSSEHSSPQSSEIGGSSDELQEAEALHQNDRAKKADSREYSADGRVQYVSRVFSWKQKQAQSTRSSREPGAEVIANGRQSEQLEADRVEEELGLGDWDSDEDPVPSRGKQRRVKIIDRHLASVLEDSPPRDLSPPKDFVNMHHLKSSMASTAYKPTPPPSSPKSSTTSMSTENTCRANPQKPIIEKPPLLQKDPEALDKSRDPVQKDEVGQSTENEERDGSDVEENKIFKELTSEIDEIISL